MGSLVSVCSLIQGKHAPYYLVTHFHVRIRATVLISLLSLDMSAAVLGAIQVCIMFRTNASPILGVFFSYLNNKTSFKTRE